jgi:hypothetical protein
MGLMDVLNGMMNGPRGRVSPGPSSSGSSGMSPITMGLLALLAYKAMKGGGIFGGSRGTGQPDSRRCRRQHIDGWPRRTL